MKTFCIKYYAAIGLLILGCSSSNNDENPLPLFQNEIEFVETLGGTRNESAKSIIKTVDGGYAILGFTQSMDLDISDKQNESYDYWLLKFNSESTLQWTKTYGGTGIDVGTNIIETSDGGFAMLGYSTSSDEDVSANAGANDYWLAKLDGLGSISWQKSFGYSGTDIGFSLLQTNDNGYLLVGVLDVTASGGAGNTRQSSSRHAGGDYWAIKLDSGGTIEWSKYYGGTFTDTPYDVIETDLGYMIVGSSDSNDVDISQSMGQYDCWVVNISDTGELLWEKSYGGSEIDEGRKIIASGDGNYIIVGDTRSSDGDILENKGGADLWVIKINQVGELLWEKTIGGSSFDVARSVKKTQDGGFLLSGSSRSGDGDVNSNQGQNDAWILKISENGNLEWENTIGGSSIDFANDAVELNDRSIIAVGETTSNDGDITSNNGFTDVLIIKLK